MAKSVNVRIARDDCRVVDISCASSVLDVKRIISNITGLEPCGFDLLFSGKVLNPVSTLKELSLGESSVLHLYKVPDRDGKECSSGDTVLTVRSNEKADKTNYQYYVYCSVCNGLEPGKLRVRCCSCSEGALILDREPSGWDDVLIMNRLNGSCKLCDRKTFAQFYFKCCQHNGDEELLALKHIRPNRRHIECVTCATESSPVLVYPCPDKHVMCIECFKSYSQVSLDQRSFIEDTDVGYSLPCPVGCEGSLIKDVHHFKLLGKDQYERYKDFGAEECLIKSGGLLCPNPGCGEGIIVDDEAEEIQCRTCRYEFCKACRQEIHQGPCRGEGATAGQNVEMTVNTEMALRARWDLQSLETIHEITKPCPRCSVKTERSGGCMHMICSRCHSEWCWLCEAEWNRNCQGDHWFG